MFLVHKDPVPCDHKVLLILSCCWCSISDASAGARAGGTGAAARVGAAARAGARADAAARAGASGAAVVVIYNDTNDKKLYWFFI